MNAYHATDGLVTVTYGPAEAVVPPGCTVAEIRLGLRDVLSVDESAKAYVDGVLVGNDHALQPGDRLKFLKENGSKEIGRVWDNKELMKHFRITRQVLQQWLDAGLPHLRLPNGQRRYVEDAMDQWFESECRKEATNHPRSRYEGLGIVVDMDAKKVVIDGNTNAVDAVSGIAPALEPRDSTRL